MLETTAFYWAPVAANVSRTAHSVQTWIHTFHAWIYTNFVKQLQDFRVNKSWQCSLHRTTPQHVHGPLPITNCVLGFLAFTCSPQVFFSFPHSKALFSNPSRWLLRAATSMLLDISQKNTASWQAEKSAYMQCLDCRCRRFAWSLLLLSSWSQWKKDLVFGDGSLQSGSTLSSVFNTATKAWYAWGTSCVPASDTLLPNSYHSYYTGKHNCLNPVNYSEVYICFSSDSSVSQHTAPSRRA